MFTYANLEFAYAASRRLRRGTTPNRDRIAADRRNGAAEPQHPADHDAGLATEKRKVRRTASAA